MKIYICKKCGATYRHDEAVNHAVYYCRKQGNEKS